MISKNFKTRVLTSIFLLLILLVAFNYNFIFIFSLLVLGAFAFIEFSFILKKILNNPFTFFLLNLIFIIYFFIISFFVIIFLKFSILKVISFIILLSCIASDIGGYVFGKYFKGPKLSTISPNKTISGSVGSITLCILTTTILFSTLIESFNYNFIILGLIISIACQIGDLIFSYLKRMAKIKDTGNILPGHGGVLDRVDGILLGFPSGLVVLYLIF